MKHAKFTLGSAAVVGAAMFFSTHAIADFSGPYVPGNWTLTNSNANGTAVHTTSTLTLTGGDNGSNAGGNTDYTIMAATSDIVSFHWEFVSADTGTFDSAGYLINGIYTTLAINLQSPTSGNVNFGATAGQIIGFRVHTVDNLFGAATLTITNFNVPAPSSLGLLGLASLVGRRRRS